MSSTALESFDLHATLQQLLDRCFSATLHRLRGVRGLLHGWAQVGVPAQDLPQLEVRFEEDLNLLGRLDWLRSLMNQPPALDRLERGEAPLVLLACAWGHGSTQEASATGLPIARDGRATIALALWLQAAVPEERLHQLRWGFEQGMLFLDHPQPKAIDWAPWSHAFRACLAENSYPEQGRLLFRRGLFEEPQQAQAVNY